MYQVGDVVLLDFGPLSAQLGVTPELRQFQERKFRINKVSHFGAQPTYELEGCVSRMGVPFTISHDWCFLVREVGR